MAIAPTNAVTQTFIDQLNSNFTTLLANETAIETTADAAAAKASNLSDLEDTQEAVDNLDFLQSGTGATTRTVTDKLRDIVDARDFGAAFDNSTDDTTALQAAIDYLGGLGGGTLLLPQGTALISATLDIDWANVSLIGKGFDGVQAAGTEATTTIKWDGADGGTMIHFRSPSGASARKLHGGGLQDLFLHSGYTTSETGADYCVKITSRDSGYFRNVMGLAPREFAFWLECLTDDLQDDRGCQHNTFVNCWSRHSSSNLDAGAFFFDGHSTTPASGTTANIAYNYLESCGALFKNGVAFRFGNSDRQFLMNCRANMEAGGSGSSLVFEGSDAGTTDFVARNNVLVGFSGQGTIIARGTTTYTNASFNNVFMMLDQGNSTPVPTIETGAGCYVQSRNDGVGLTSMVTRHAIGAPSLETGQNTALVQLTNGRIANESLRIENGSSDHIRLADPASDYESVDSEWGIAVGAADGNLRFNRLSGSGFLVSNAGLRSSSPTLGIGYTTGGGGTVTQITSKATLVSLNRMSGLITTHDAELAAGASVTFRWNNSGMAATDVVILNHIDSEATSGGGGTKGAYKLDVKCDDGEAYITLTNITSGALSEAVAIRFAVIKGVTS